MKRLLIRGSVIAFAFLAFAAPVLASGSFYSWSMSNRVVDGSRNGQFHGLSAGALRNGGQIWATSTDSVRQASPITVNIDVMKDELFDTMVCRVSVVPSQIINRGTQYDKNCGTIAAGSYYLLIWKSTDDGWNEAGQGDLVTQ
jgi:hypothetical protein